MIKPDTYKIVINISGASIISIILGFCLFSYLSKNSIQNSRIQKDRRFQRDLPTANGIVNDGPVTNESVRPMLVEAMKYLNEGSFKKAEDVYRQIAKSYPNEVSAYHGIGTALAYQSEWKEARVYFEKALSLKPGSVTSLCGLGATYGYYNDFEKSIFYYEKALAIEPQFALAHYGMGVNLESLNKCDLAIT
jgi:tetratricopeptide (TPR) repeat protein